MIICDTHGSEHFLWCTHYILCPKAVEAYLFAMIVLTRSFNSLFFWQIARSHLSLSWWVNLKLQNYTQIEFEWKSLSTSDKQNMSPADFCMHVTC